MGFRFLRGSVTLDPVRRRAGLAAIAFVICLEGPGVAGTPASSAWEVRQILPISGVNAVTQAADGALWIAANSEAYRYDGLADLRVVDKGGMPVLPGEHIFASKDGTLWGWTSSRAALQAFAGGQVRSVGPFGDNALRIAALAERPAGEIVLGTNQGLFRLEPISLRPRLLQGTQHMEVNALLADDAGALLVAHKGGLARLGSDGTLKSLSLPTKHLRVQVLARGQQGIWVASGEQLGLLQADNIHWKAMPAGLVPHSLAQDRGGRLWLADTAQLAVLENDKFELLADEPFGRINDLVADHEGNVWVGSDEGGLIRIRRPVVRRFTAQELGQRELSRVATAEDGSVWIAGNAGVARFKDEDAGFDTGASAQAAWPQGLQGPVADAEIYNGVAGLCPGPFEIVVPRRQGGVWIGGPNGLARVDEHGVGSCLSQALPDMRISALWEAPNNTLWIGTQANESGLTRLRDGKFSNVKESNGLPCDTVKALTGDESGHLWFACPEKIARVVLQEIERAADDGGFVHGFGFVASDGIFFGQPPSAGSQTLLADRQGRIWFLAKGAVSRISDLADYERMPALPPVIAELRVGNVSVPLSGTEVLQAPVGDGHVDVLLTVVRLSFPSHTRFRVYLSGHFRGWWYHDLGNLLRIQNVGIGRHDLSVSASNGFGRWSEPKILRFELNPPFFRRQSFFITLAAVLALLGFALHILRLRRLRYGYKQQQHERERIARELHDGLAQGATSLGLHLDALSRELPEDAVTAKGIAQQTRALLADWHGEVRQMIWNLRVEAHATPDLDIALAQAVERALKITAMQTARPKITIKVKSGKRALAGIAAHELPYIIQEGVINAVKHAKAQTVDIRVEASDLELMASVVDDGIGMPHPWDAEALATAGHFGLIGMHERARRAGGYLQVQSEANAGCRLLIVIPLKGVGERDH